MARNEAPAFRRGESYTNVSAMAGYEWNVEDLDYSSTSGALPQLSGNMVTIRLVKNSSGIALLPGRLGRFKAGTNYTEIDGYGFTTGDKPVAGIDEYLPAAGVPNGDYFFVVTKGPFAALTDLAAGANNLLPEEIPVVALTAASSQATTAGRIAPISTIAASTHLGSELLGVIGRNLSAKTTANTNVSIRIYMNNPY